MNSPTHKNKDHIASLKLPMEIKSDYIKKMKELSANDFPVRESYEAVTKVFDQVKHQIIPQIKKDAVLISMPSTSMINLSSFVASHKIAKELGNDNININGNLLVWPKHQFRASNRKNFEDKITEVKDYEPKTAMQSFKDKIGDRPVYIVADISRSGESAINFERVLENNGIKVENHISLVALSKEKLTDKDIHEAAEALNKLLPKEKHEQVKSDMKDLFTGQLKGLKRLFMKSIEEKPEKAAEIAKGIHESISIKRENGLLADKGKQSSVGIEM